MATPKKEETFMPEEKPEVQAPEAVLTTAACKCKCETSRFKGGFRHARGAYPAILLGYTEKRSTAGTVSDTNTAGSTIKKLATVLYFSPWVHSNMQLMENVEIGKAVGQFWHDFQEMEDEIAAERDRRLERDRQGQAAASGRSEGKAATVSAG